MTQDLSLTKTFDITRKVEISELGLKSSSEAKPYRDVYPFRCPGELEVLEARQTRFDFSLPLTLLASCPLFSNNTTMASPWDRSKRPTRLVSLANGTSYCTPGPYCGIPGSRVCLDVRHHSIRHRVSGPLLAYMFLPVRQCGHVPPLPSSENPMPH